MDTITNQQTINNAHNIPFMTHAIFIYLFIHALVSVFQLLTVLNSTWVDLITFHLN